MNKNRQKSAGIHGWHARLLQARPLFLAGGASQALKESFP